MTHLHLTPDQAWDISNEDYLLMTDFFHEIPPLHLVAASFVSKKEEKPQEKVNDIGSLRKLMPMPAGNSQTKSNNGKFDKDKADPRTKSLLELFEKYEENGSIFSDEK